MASAARASVPDVAAAAAVSGAERAASMAAARELRGQAVAALALLGDGPLQPTGAVADALAAGRLLRTGSDEALDHLELRLRAGAIDASERINVGEGMNGILSRVRVGDPTDAAAQPLWVVEKTASQQAAQEEFGWRFARELGIDHLVAAAMRRAEDGIARIVHRPGRAVSFEGITDVHSLERTLTASYLADETLKLSPAEAAQAARIDRQLLQVFDYLIANNDRSTSNALHDAATRTFTFFDSGHAGRGMRGETGGTLLEPALQLFQAGKQGGRVDLDPAVVDYLRQRLTHERIDEIHRAVYGATDMPGPAARTTGEKFYLHAASDWYRTSIAQRLDHVLETGGYTHRPYVGDPGGDMPPLVNEIPNARGLGNVRGAFARF